MKHTDSMFENLQKKFEKANIHSQEIHPRIINLLKNKFHVEAFLLSFIYLEAMVDIVIEIVQANYDLSIHIFKGDSKLRPIKFLKNTRPYFGNKIQSLEYLIEEDLYKKLVDINNKRTKIIHSVYNDNQTISEIDKMVHNGAQDINMAVDGLLKVGEPLLKEFMARADMLDGIKK